MWADRKRQAAFVDRVIGFAGCNRSYPTGGLRAWIRRVMSMPVGGPPLMLTVASGRTLVRARPGVYGERVFVALKQVR